MNKINTSNKTANILLLVIYCQNAFINEFTKSYADKISTINTNNIDISKTETLVNTSNTDNIYNAINIRKTRTCGSGKKYKNCCGKNQ